MWDMSMAEERSEAGMTDESSTVPAGRVPSAQAAVDVALIRLGQHLSQFRETVKRQSQFEAATEMGISRATLARMESGIAPGVAIGAWLTAFQYMGQLEGFMNLSHDPYALVEAEIAEAQRRFKEKMDKQAPPVQAKARAVVLEK